MYPPEEARTVFSAAHYLYIPICVFAGVIIGWILGSRSARGDIARLQQLLDADQERQAEERLSKAER